MAWRVAESLEKLRDQINAAWPNRSKVSDGTIGDAAHASSDSDHNPWVKDGSMGVVTAMDITHDPAHGVDAGKIVAQLVKSKDKRIKYIIWDGRIISSTVSPWTWRPYMGSNPHDHHFHISVQATKALYDDRQAWVIRSVPAWKLVRKKKDGVTVVIARGSLLEMIKWQMAHRDKIRQWPGGVNLRRNR